MRLGNSNGVSIDLSNLRLNYCEVVFTMSKKSNFLDTHFRITREQKNKLEQMGAMTGLKSSEVLREIINNVDEDTLKNSFEHNQEMENRQIEILARQKYLINLFKNVTSNVNQIAKYVNYQYEKVDNQRLKDAFEWMIKDLTELRHNVYECSKGDINKER